jgi:hypothetical protein
MLPHDGYTSHRALVTVSRQMGQRECRDRVVPLVLAVSA